MNNFCLKYEKLDGMNIVLEKYNLLKIDLGRNRNFKYYNF